MPQSESGTRTGSEERGEQQSAGVPERRGKGTAAPMSTSIVVTVQSVPATAGPAELHVPGAVADALGLYGGGEIAVRAGGSTGVAAARIIDQRWPTTNVSENQARLGHNERTGVGESSVIRLTPTLLSRLAIPVGTRLHARYDVNTAMLSLGPFVGILALRARRGPLYGDHDPFFRALTRQGKRLGIAAFMFSPSGVDWRTKHIFGYTFSSAPAAPGWRKHKFPLPDAIYDRIQTRRAESKPKYIRFRANLARHVPRWFNESGFFDKWRLHRLLWENERLRPYLPETLQYRDRADLEHILRGHNVAFLKPMAGSLGIGIIRVQRTGGGFTVTYEPGERVLMRRASTLSALGRIVDRLVRDRPYIVQQGLPLATWKGRPFDIRILLQRTVGGAWAVTKIFSRIAAPGNITSNLSRGADPCNIRLLLRRVFGRNWTRLHKQLHAVGMHCAKEIERTLPGTVGELGLDLGISRNRRVWLIEANSKPFLQMTREAGSAQTLALSVRRPLQFAKHLAAYE